MSYQGGESVPPDPHATSRPPGGALALWRNARVHTKVASIVILATLGLSWFGLMSVVDKRDVAIAASQAGTTATLSVKAGDLLHATQRERGRSSQFVSSKGAKYRDDLARQRQDTDARAKALEQYAKAKADRLPVGVRESVKEIRVSLAELDALRRRVDKLQLDPTAVITRYNAINRQILDLIAELAASNAEPSLVARLQAYLAFLAAKEGMGQERAQLSSVFITNRYGPRQYITVVSLVAAQQDSLDQFERVATPDVLRTWKQARATAAFAQVAAYEGEALALPSGGHVGVDAAAWWDAATSKIDQMKVVEDVQSQSIVSLARSVEGSANAAAQAALAVVILLLLITVGLAVAATRSIARPVQRLTRAATAVADLADRELARVTDVEDADEHTPRLAAIEVSSRDEVGELAEAFNRVQTVATQLVERQIMMRQNVGQMFANVAQRTQNLVNRQLTLVDQLEGDEKNRHVLSTLYKLDHLSTRLGRNAKNLLVISGARDDPRMIKPTPLATTVRSALGEIEDYDRVRIETICDVTVAASLVTDLVVVVAELLENATTYSPPGTFVDVHAVVADDRCQISVVDYGMGMPADQLAEENRRLVERERLDIAPSGVLGLFVVGRLARRHDLIVDLLATPGGGTTATVAIPPDLFTHNLPVRALVAAPAGYPRPADGPSPRGLSLPTAMMAPPDVPTATMAVPLAHEFSWFSPPVCDTGMSSRGRDAARATRWSALLPEASPASDESVTTCRRASIEHATPVARTAESTVELPIERPAEERAAVYATAPIEPRPAASLPTGSQPRPREGLVRRVRGARLPAGALPPDAGTGLGGQPMPTSAADTAAAARAAMDGFQTAINRFAGPRGPRSEAFTPGSGVAAAAGTADRDEYATGAPKHAAAQRAMFDALAAGLANAVAETAGALALPPVGHDPNEEVKR
jgi:signal transduction histidine kinase